MEAMARQSGISEIIKIPDEYLIIQPEDNTAAINIRNIDKIIEEAARQGKLFSVLSIEWAVSTRPVLMEGYKNFQLFKNNNGGLYG